MGSVASDEADGMEDGGGLEALEGLVEIGAEPDFGQQFLPDERGSKKEGKKN